MLNEREKIFQSKIRSIGLTCEESSERFYLEDCSYTPDFYIKELNVYVEVVGTRQAHHQNSKKYQSIVQKFGFNFLLCSYDLSNFFPDKFLSMSQKRDGTCTFNGCDRQIETMELCSTHYSQLNNGIGLKPINERGAMWCWFPGCESNTGIEGGYCQKHRSDLPQKRDTGNAMCLFDGCGRHSVTTGLCRYHYNQKYAGKKLTPLKRVYRKRSAGFTTQEGATREVARM
jgi:hypothetical protein